MYLSGFYKCLLLEYPYERDGVRYNFPHFVDGEIKMTLGVIINCTKKLSTTCSVMFNQLIMSSIYYT